MSSRSAGLPAARFRASRYPRSVSRENPTRGSLSTAGQRTPKSKGGPVWSSRRRSAWPGSNEPRSSQLSPRRLAGRSDAPRPAARGRSGILRELRLRNLRAKRPATRARRRSRSLVGRTEQPPESAAEVRIASHRRLVLDDAGHRLSAALRSRHVT
jgi:hypothetical protein